MKNTKSLRTKIFLTMVLSTVMVVLLFSLLTAKYFLWGVASGISLGLESEAKSYARAYEQDPKTPLPEGAYLSAYSDLQGLPDYVRKHLHSSKIEHSKLLIFNDVPESDNSAVPARALCELDVCNFYFFYPYQLNESQWVYLVGKTEPGDFKEDKFAIVDRAIYFLIPFIIGTLALMVFIVVRLLKSVSTPIQEIAVWADSLTIESLDKAPPDFQYTELNLVAKQLHGAFTRIGDVLAKEREFLTLASHELRTPIAVIHSNLTLLDELNKERQPKGPENKIVQRLNRASKTMKDLTQTLLWLSRDDSNAEETQKSPMESLVRTAMEDNAYLLEHKSVEVNLDVNGPSVEIISTPGHIVVSNLIRNAFQYTQSGRVDLAIQGNTFSIENSCAAQENNAPSEKDYGFGLGLELVQRMANKYGWHFAMSEQSSGRLNRVRFS